MGIGVEEAVHEELLVEGLGEPRRHVAARDPQTVHLLQIGDLESLHEGHGQDLTGAELVDDVGDGDVRLPLEVLLHPAHARGFVHVVGLPPQQIDQRVVDGGDVVDGHEPLVDPKGQTNDPHVGADDAPDARIEELHRHVRSVVEPGLVYLPQRRGCQRRVLDLREALVGLGVEARAEALLERGVRHRRHRVLQHLELLAVHVRQEPAHDRQHLTELDVDAAQPKDRVEEPVGVLVVHLAAAPLEPGRDDDVLLAGDGIIHVGAEEPRERELRHVARKDDPEDPQGPRQPDVELHRRWGILREAGAHENGFASRRRTIPRLRSRGPCGRCPE